LTQASPEVLVVDFGMGNVRNVLRALARVGARARSTDDADEIAEADRLVFPGVGHLGDCMKALEGRGLPEALRGYVRGGRPYLGICLGLEVLLTEGEEGSARGLDLVPGRVCRFPDAPRLPVPHMGWNRMRVTRPHPVLKDGYFYFVHSYRAEGVPEEMVLGRTDYGEEFASVLGFDGCLAVQFHPEKSQRAGLALLESFLAWSP
jgi:glutamine amidotransferase